MDKQEREARAKAAGKMGLVKDPEGLNLPDDLWMQALPPAVLAGRLSRAAAENAALRAEIDTMRTAGICEIAARNPQVMEYMRHWETRAEAAEAETARLRGLLAEARNGGLIYWEPRSGRGCIAKSDMLGRIDAALATPAQEAGR